ncbi:MAG: Ig-like domain-containing protein [Bacteroidota bacterium]
MKRTEWTIWNGWGAALGVLLLLWSCAQTSNLSGGPEDKTPPGIDSLKSTPNFQVRFEQQPIELTFDEWVVLKDVFNQVVISPPLQNGKPEVSLRRKTVRVDFPPDEELRPNATYIINFGEAIRDLTADNIAPDLRFVFSTGDYIDSLQITGRIVDAYTNDPVEKALMMLYDNLADSVVRTEVPFYFNKTDSSGQFRLQNLRPDTFKTFALLSTDPNYLFDQTSEKIGFVDSLIVLNDSAKIDLRIRLFQQLAPLRLNRKEPRGYGYLPLVYNRPPWDATVELDRTDLRVVRLQEADTLKLWYHWMTDESWSIYTQQDTTSDTLLIDTTGRAAFMRAAKLRPQNRSVSQSNLNPFKGIKLRFNRPLNSWDTSQIYLLEDTLARRVKPQLRIDSTDQRQLHIQYQWRAETPYELNIYPGGLLDLFDRTLDTLTQTYLAKRPDDYGKFIINVVEVDSSQQYVFQLLKGEQLLSERILRDTSRFRFEYPGLDLGKDYTIRLIEDLIPNGRWDTGSYDERRQPERLSVYKLQELRANFEAEEELRPEF